MTDPFFSKIKSVNHVIKITGLTSFKMILHTEGIVQYANVDGSILHCCQGASKRVIKG